MEIILREYRTVLWKKSQSGASLLPVTRRVCPGAQLLCVVIGSDWVLLSDRWTDNDSGAYQCQQIGSPAKRMIAITALVMFNTTVGSFVDITFFFKYLSGLCFFL